MAMIEIYIHLYLFEKEAYDKIFVIASFPIVPRVGEKILLSSNHKAELLNLLEKHLSCNNDEMQEWEEAIEEFVIVEEVAYNTEDKTVHIELSRNVLI